MKRWITKGTCGGALAAALLVVGCGGSSTKKDAGVAGPFANSGTGSSGSSGIGSGAPGTPTTSPGSGGSTSGAGGSGPAPSSPGSFGNVGVSGGQDFAAFRRALDDGKIPGRDTIDATGFFGEHYTSLPPPSCGRTFCLHGMLSVSKDLARGGTMTLLQMGMNSTVDPATVAKPALDLAVVLDHSGSMAAAGKMDFAKQGVQLLIDALGPQDTFTLIIFDDNVKRLFGPARVTDKAALKGQVAEIQPAGGTNIYDALEAGYQAALGAQDDSEQRRVIFLTDGLPTVGNTDAGQIRAMSSRYNQKYVGLTTIGLGSDVNLQLLRGLAEAGGGNFYYVEKPAAVREVFTEELAFFVAPIAYDLELSFSQVPGYVLKTVYGTALWQSMPAGGQVNVPSVFLVSRTSSDASPATGGRRGGGSAILAELSPASGVMASRPLPVGHLRLRYRLPGHTDFEVQETDVVYPETAPAPEVADFYSASAIEKNTIILDFFLAFRDATTKAQTDPRGALTALTAFQERMTGRLEGWTDEDLLDDMKILAQYIAVLKRAAGVR
jgi:Ca-activated chloride channel family protein